MKSIPRTHLLVIAAILMVAITARIAWMAYTRYIAEDAYITFRYAHQLAAGNGFVHNTGDRLYGTTTPLYTLLMAGWLLLGVGNAALGASLLNLAASAATLVFVWLAVRRLGFSLARQAAALLVLALSLRLLSNDTRGMETPWVIGFMAASWWALVTGRAKLAGLLAGLLLWTRVDLFLWPLALVGVQALADRRKASWLAALTGLTYLPWVVFATLYFGSPIPHTVTAKWVAYLQYNTEPAIVNLPIVLNYLSMFHIPQAVFRLSLTAWLTIGIAAWQTSRTADNQPVAVLPIFALLETAWLVTTRATFFSHYMVPLLWVVLVLFGMGLGSLWDWLERRHWVARLIYATGLILFFGTNVVLAVSAAPEYRDFQRYRHEQALAAAGQWLYQHTSAGSTVLLEPLGYAGYYADRVMLDEVGLVTPQVVAYKRERITEAFLYAVLLQPDYWVIHCDDALGYLESSAQGEIDFTARFTHVVTFNPLGFDPTQGEKPTEESALARDSCYEIWMKLQK